jgi:mono/diheme cytochrome c family protein
LSIEGQTGMRSKIVPLLILGGMTAMMGGACAQTVKSTWDGVYSDAQATRGSALYFQNCSMCHGPTLGGNGEAPPLVGRFIPDWQGTTLDQLLDKISTTMPLNHPGTLSAAANADLLAFILKANNFPAGTVDLPGADGLKMIGFDAVKPPPAPAMKSAKPKKP